MNNLLFCRAALVFFCALTCFQIKLSAQSTSPQPAPQDQSANQDSDDLINPDRPGIADGSSVIGGNHFQIESGVQAEFRKNGADTEHTTFIPLLFRIGIDRHWEARIEGNGLSTVNTETPGLPSERSTGLAPFSFGFKYHIQDSNGPSHPSLGAIVRIFPAWGTGQFSSNRVTGDARFVADWDIAPKLSLNPNAGIGFYEDNGRSFTAGLFALTLNYLPTKHLNPFVDVGVQTPEQIGGRSAVILDGGIAYILGKNVQLDASAGTGVHGDTTPHPFVSFGVSWITRIHHGG